MAHPTSAHPKPTTPHRDDIVGPRPEVHKPHGRQMLMGMPHAGIFIGLFFLLVILTVSITLMVRQIKMPSGETTASSSHSAPAPSPTPSSSMQYRLKPDGQEWVDLKPGERLTITLKPNEWFSVKTDGKRYNTQWVTPDRKLKVRFEFWHGVTTEQEFVAGQPVVDIEVAPCNWQFVHSTGGTVWITPL